MQRRMFIPLAALSAVALVAPGSAPAAAGAPGRSVAAPAQHASASTRAAAVGDNDAIVHLFEWNWASIGRECTSVLGPRGYGGVQVSPPQEHVVLADRGYPWWQDYQPVSYQLSSRRGDRAAFAAMVDACHGAGVQVYVDAVVNHMTGSDATGGTGSGGNPFQPYSYPAVPYSRSDFHDPCAIQDYTNRGQVQNCQLSSLTDLRTESPTVRDALSAYLRDLIGLGVDGFRVDAAKHLPVEDLAAVLSAAGGTPYVYQEVIEGGPGEIPPSEYTGLGDVTDFRYGDTVGDAFRSGGLADLRSLPNRMAVTSDQAQVFIDNHDTERNGRTKLNYASGDRYYLAEAFMLAYPFGTPSVMSGYAFSNSDQGPPADASGRTTDASCGTGTWTCQHRDTRIAGMVGLRNVARGQDVTDWWQGSGGQIAFGRGDTAYVAFNTDGATLSRQFDSSLPAGTYCDVLAGEVSGSSCTGRSITVAADGTFTATLGPNQALALHTGARVASPPAGATAAVTFAVTAQTAVGQEVYVVGSVPGLGTWNSVGGVQLSSASYPVWRGTVNLPAGSTVEYKYLKRTATGAVTWESDPNRTVVVPASGSLTLTDTWR
ncbi:MAG: carbohydrate-binding module family 20 domain-containing protein [Angustibacter sp.]